MIKLKSLFRRGQGPSGSKHSANSASNAEVAATKTQLKGTSSVSSLEHIEPIKNSKKSHQHGGSKDRLIDQKIKGSRDKLGASRESLDIKETKRNRIEQQQHQQQLLQQQQQQQQYQQHQQQQLNNQMPLIQQHVGNNNLIDQRDVANYASVVDPLAKELTDINFDGPREVSEF